MLEIGRLLAASQEIISIYQDKPIDNNEANSCILLAASTIESLLEKVKEENEIYWMLEAAVAYSMIGEFKEARRRLNEINLDFFQETAFTVVIVTIDPSKATLFNIQNFSSPFREALSLTWDKM